MPTDATKNSLRNNYTLDLQFCELGKKMTDYEN